MIGIERRLQRLETQGRGQGRVIVIVWPNGDSAVAMRVKGVEERPDDLVININKGVDLGANGWVSVDGVRLN